MERSVKVANTTVCVCVCVCVFLVPMSEFACSISKHYTTPAIETLQLQRAGEGFADRRLLVVKKALNDDI